jgi:hypothetical protein
MQCLTNCVFATIVQAEYSLRTFTGQATIMSLDFHPLCSCDSDGQVLSWRANYVNCLTCVRVSRVRSENFFEKCFMGYFA